MNHPILDLPLEENDAQAATIREYFKTLLTTLWIEQDGFSGKRPLGNSGWDCDILIPLVKAGLIQGSIDEDGYLEDLDDEAGEALILAAIEEMCTGEVRTSTKMSDDRTADKKTYREWIESERSLLWCDFGHASDRAIREPSPLDRKTWSIEMESIADRISEATELLGTVTNWQNIDWRNVPYYQAIEQTPIPEEAWNWAENYLKSCENANI